MKKNLQDLKSTASEIDEVYARLKAADEYDCSAGHENEKSEEQLEDERNRDDQEKASRGDY